MSVLSEDKLFTSLNQRFRDVCINPNTGALYVALNGTQYPGTAPNKIIMFAPQDNTNSIVSQPTIGQELKLYPNPAESMMTLEAASTLVGSVMTIYNNEGKEVQTIKIESGKQVIDISRLSEGAYWTVASSSLGTVTRTFVKSSK
jgi:hypothetical protein